MSAPDEYQLYADRFTPEDQTGLADLNCGEEPWSRAATDWIRGSEVLDSIAKLESDSGSLRHRRVGVVSQPAFRDSAILLGHFCPAQRSAIRIFVGGLVGRFVSGLELADFGFQ